MTIEEAFEMVISSASFKDTAKVKDKKGGHYRLLRSRYNRGKLKYGAMVDILIEFDYKVSIKK